MIGTTNGRSVTVTLNVAAGTGTFTSNLRLFEGGVRLSVSCTRSMDIGSVVPGSCGAAVPLAGSVNNLVIQGIHFYAHTRDASGGSFSRSGGGYGIRFVAGTNNALVEDCEIDCGAMR